LILATILRFLLENGTKVDSGDDSSLIRAIIYGHVEVVRILLEYGANGRRVEWKALHFAVTGNDLEIVKLLLDAGGDVHANDALQIARDREYFAIADYIMSYSQHL
jgi:ankyrin repeat protein